ncbi:MarR family transcriptional regulator [Thioclava sp. GXIMD4216]|uniref:MarR family winged helix-turn-helix transcriptional regulator n=1 Tax=Thioclava sp. GXIMD4216 TaxID=3131929 RepID=UPI0030CE1BB4
MPHLTDHDYDPLDNFGRLLIDAASLLSRAVDKRARSLGISGPQLVVLIRIGGGANRTAAELCRGLDYDSGAMTRMLDRLIKLGLVQKAPDPKDGRMIILSLTEKGAALYPALKPVAIDVINQHLQGFGSEEVQQFGAMLRRLIENADPLVGRSETGADASAKKDNIGTT